MALLSRASYFRRKKLTTITHSTHPQPRHMVASTALYDATAAAMELRDVSMVFPDGDQQVTALNHVSLALQPGTLTALVGESGSGKSTFLSVAATLLRPTSGTVLLQGQDITAYGDDSLARLRREKIGIVFQSPNMLASLTVREQLLVTDHIRGLRGRELKKRKARADELLAAVGLPGYGDRKATKLSGGQRQRVNIARALMGSPAALLADEPTSALDHRLSQEIVELLRTVTDEFQLATLLITHDRSQLAVADTVAKMLDGTLSIQN